MGEEAAAAGDDAEYENEDEELKLKSTKAKVYSSHCLPDWFGRVDENGSKVSSYLRCVDGNKSLVFCCMDNTIKGFCSCERSH